MKHVLTLATVAIGCLSAFAQAMPVHADPPGTEGPFEGSAFLLDCGDFEVFDDFVVSSSFKPIFDGDGQLVGFTEQVWGTDTLRNAVTGKSYTGKFHNTVRVDFESGLG